MDKGYAHGQTNENPIFLRNRKEATVTSKNSKERMSQVISKGHNKNCHRKIQLEKTNIGRMNRTFLKLIHSPEQDSKRIMLQLRIEQKDKKTQKYIHLVLRPGQDSNLCARRQQLSRLSR